ncbi:MAG: hypothetical protein L0Z70_00665 [Chloroflexi bacterium]|nr:hypothetical protein [Chloroflexota bacterium]
MLNLTIAMLRSWTFLLILFALAWAARPAHAQTATPPAPSPSAAAVFIRAPAAGQALQGRVEISGGSTAPGARGYQVFFAYQNNPTDTWFLIASSSEPVSDGVLAAWDTSTITDGEYKLRLVVQLEGGQELRAEAAGLRVRNYSPIETNTPTAIPPSATPQPGETPLPTLTPTATQTPIPPTATALPPNPAEISRQDVYISLGKGALGVLGFFSLAGAYLLAQKIKTRRLS